MTAPSSASAGRSWSAALSRWLPTSRTSRRFVGISFIDAVGSGLFLAGAPLFFTRDLGLTVQQVGIGVSLSGLAGMLGLVPIGRLADRVGSKPTLVLLHLWRGLGFACYPFVHSAPMFFLLAFAIGIAEWSAAPSVQALVASVEEGRARVRTMAAMGSIRNAGFTVGSLLATLVIAFAPAGGYLAVVLVDAASYFVAAWLLVRLAVPGRPPVTAPDGARPRRRFRLSDGRYLVFTGLNGVLYLHTVLLAVGLPLWIVTHTSAPRALAAGLWVVNTAVVIVLQVPLSKGSDGATPAARRQNWAAWSLAGCCLLVAVTGHLAAWPAGLLVLVAVVLLTLGEIWQSVGGWGISYAYAQPEQIGYYLSVYNLGLTAATIVGPVLVTFAVIQAGPLGWACLAAVFVGTGAAVRLCARGASPAAVADRTEPDPVGEASQP